MEVSLTSEKVNNKTQTRAKQFEIIDFLKGYSIFTIMVFHYLNYIELPSPFDKMVFFGGTGVHLFILLSGFGLYYSHIYKPSKAIDFIKKRGIKIYTPYIFVVLLAALTAVFIPIYNNSLYALGGHIFLYKMFDENIVGSYGYQLWFMSMILQFYFAFHIITWIKSKMPDHFFLISALVVSAIWAISVFLIGKGGERVWNSFFLQYYWEFALGMIIAKRVANNKPLLGANTHLFLVLIIGIVNCALYGYLALEGGSTGKLFNDYFALTGYSLLAIFLYRLNLKFVNNVFTFIGKISLSVYLLHVLVLLIVAQLNLKTVPTVIISFVLIFPISSLYQRGIDRFLQLLK